MLWRWQSQEGRASQTVGYWIMRPHGWGSGGIILRVVCKNL